MSTVSPRSPAPPDPRPLLGEPLGLDLLNTHWIENGELHDLLGDQVGLRVFMHSMRLEPADRDERSAHGLPVSAGALKALRRARDVIQAVAEHPADGAARTAFNEVLSLGRRERFLGERGVRSRLTVDDRQWTLAWLAADNYLELLASRPDRIRRCEHEHCILWFLDVSRSGTRRWCSMAVCGNRAKAGRHHRRHAAATAADPA